ncbi:MAG: monovalent cation/H(+) antiporter subunit G [Silvanigrellales bacterium]|jgi:multicomponent Na+:H+ antiporter subunit G|nr:monovalent cation/H(+) antiporter subunit G [Silvanigrellales bacterium]
MKDVFISVLIVTGSGLFLLAALGLVRLPDALCRAHAVAKGTCLGVLLVLIATALALQGKGVTLLILATALFQLLTIPIAAHLFGRLAYRKNIPLWKEKPLDREGNRGE